MWILGRGLKLLNVWNGSSASRISRSGLESRAEWKVWIRWAPLCT
jgi:hypothetical protein